MIMLQAVNMPTCPGVALPKNPALMPGHPSIPEKVPLRTTYIALFPTQAPGLFSGQFTCVNSLLYTLHLVSPHIVQRDSGKCWHGYTKGQEKKQRSG